MKSFNDPGASSSAKENYKSIFSYKQIRVLAKPLLYHSWLSKMLGLQGVFLTLLLGYLSSYYYLYMPIERFWNRHSDEVTISDVRVLENCSQLLIENVKKSYLSQEAYYSLYYNNSEYEYIPDGSIDSLLSGQVREEHDPRFIVSLYLDSILHNLQQNYGKFKPDFTLDFTWSTWLDLKTRFKSSVVKKTELNCEKFQNLFKIGHKNFEEFCIDLSSPHGYPNFKFLNPIDIDMAEDARRIAGTSYLLHTAPIPERILFLGVGPNDSALVVPLSLPLEESPYDKNGLNQLVDNYIINRSDRLDEIERMLRDGIQIEFIANALSSYWESQRYQENFIRDEDLNYDIFRPLGIDNEETLNLNKNDFMLDSNVFIKTLENRLELSYKNNVLNDLDKKLLTTVKLGLLIKPNFTKYFHEATILGKSGGSHYDWRFFSSLKHSNYEKRAILHRLTRAWLNFSRSAGLQTWIAHGSLLGWYWNGLNLPWDQDLDVQMTTNSLLKLARNYNQTIVVDLHDKDNLSLGIGSYLIDVSSSFFSRKIENGLNTIDARFIDTETGIYVDITALSFTNAADGMRKNAKELNQLLDPEYITKESSRTVDKEALEMELSNIKTEFLSNQTIFNCRNNHFYSLNELTPLKPTLFEGVRGFVPKHFKEILKREYKSGLHNYQYEKYKYRPVLDIWVPNKICKKDSIGNNCFHEETLLEAKQTRSATAKHRREMNARNSSNLDFLDEVKTFRVDSWIIHRSKKLQKLIS